MQIKTNYIDNILLYLIIILTGVKNEKGNNNNTKVYRQGCA